MTTFFGQKNLALYTVAGPIFLAPHLFLFVRSYVDGHVNVSNQRLSDSVSTDTVNDPGGSTNDKFCSDFTGQIVLKKMLRKKLITL